MQRRDFIKISALTGVISTLEACGHPEQQLIRFVPEEDLIPGIATWKPSICTLCSAGCGLLVRVMQGEAEVVRHGQHGLIKMGLAKKLEGNPQNPVNQGKLCARGQAGLQVLYNPDRITHPIKRTGARGSGQFQEISWDDALKEVASHLTTLQSSKQANSLAFLARPLRGQRHELIERFLKAFGAPPAVWYEPFDEAVLRQANLLSFGHAALPTIDLGRADYVLSFGADFLGTWNSPVAQSAGYGEMRQGRPGRRAKFVQIESRMSQTGANCDEWIACQPGTEGALALGIAHVILNEKLAAQGAGARAGSQIAGWSAGLPEFAPEAVEKQTGVSAAVIKRLAHEIAQSGSATAIIGGAPLAQTNGLFNALAVNALESLVDTGREQGAGQRPILGFTPEPSAGAAGKPSALTQASLASLNAFTRSALSGQPGAPQMLLLYDANPIFSAPPGTRIREAIARIPYIVSFGSFIDETSAQADLILPDHAPLESWLDSIPESGSFQTVASLAAAGRCPAARHALDARRAAWSGAADLAATLPRPFPGPLSMLCCAPPSFRSVPAAALSTQRRTRSSGKLRSTQGGWWSVPSTATTAGSRSAASATCGNEWRRSTGPWRRLRRSLPAAPPNFHSTFCPTPRSRLAMVRWRICPGCRSCPMC
jgi:anaerobic selenocysteine-containing dehydrogenase